MLGGYLVYEGMLRTENTFWDLHEKRPSIIDGKDGYESFREDFEAALEAEFQLPLSEQIGGPGRWSIPAAEFFSLVLVIPLFAVGLQAEQGHPFIAGVMAVLDFFLVVVFFQFLVLIEYFNVLLQEHGPLADPDSFRLKYVPFHPDGYAGFREFGQFSTRVNSLLVVGGLYVVYRLYVVGVPTFPDANAETIRSVAWSVSHLVPLVGYVIAVILWLYFSFWQVHEAMRGGRSAAVQSTCGPDDESRERDDPAGHDGDERRSL